MKRDIGLKGSDFVLKRAKDKVSLRRAKKFDLNVIETDEMNIVEVSDRTAKVKVGSDEFIVPKSAFDDFKRVSGSKKTGKLSRSIRLKFEKKENYGTPFVSDIWVNDGDVDREDAVLIGEKIALFLSAKSDLIDISAEIDEETRKVMDVPSARVPFRFFEKRQRLPGKMAFTRGYNVGSTDDLRLRSEGKALGEVMYRCDRLYDISPGKGVDICFGLKIREDGERFVAERIARFIKFSAESGQSVVAREVVPKIENIDVDDIVLGKELIESNDTDTEALRIFEDLGFEDIRDEVRFFDYTKEGQTSSIIKRKRINTTQEIESFNAFIDTSVDERSKLDTKRIKQEFRKRLLSNADKDGDFAKTMIKTLIEVRNDDTLFSSNKTAFNPTFNKRFNHFIATKLMNSMNLKDYLELEYEFVD